MSNVIGFLMFILGIWVIYKNKVNHKEVKVDFVVNGRQTTFHLNALFGTFLIFVGWIGVLDVITFGRMFGILFFLVGLKVMQMYRISKSPMTYSYKNKFLNIRKRMDMREGIIVSMVGILLVMFG